MTDQLISFETAILAKEKGFSRKDIDAYPGITFSYTINENGYDEGKLNHVHMGIPALTQSLLQKWLREKHNIQMFLHPYSDGTFACDVIDNKTIYGDNKPHRCNSPRLNTYEEALEVGLQEALKLII